MKKKSNMKWWHQLAPCIVIVLVALSILTGCNLFQEKKTIDYKSAGKLPPLDVPPDLIAPTVDERYSIPDANSPDNATFSTYNQERGGQPITSASSSSLLPTSDQGAHIERAGTQRWLVVPQPPETVWPIVKEFWQELGFLIKIENPETGILETDWAENRAKIPQDFIRTILSTVLDSLYSTSERDKFRTRLERGLSGTTEIYISHRGMDEVIEGGSTQRTIWQPRPADPDLEAEMLSLLMLRFGAEEERVKLELATVNNAAQARAYISPEQKDVLIVNESFDRSWRRVGLALDRIGFTVEDRNRLEGVYFVRYVDPDADSHKSGDDDGILSGLIFWSKDDAPKAEKYHIQVSETGASRSHVKVLTENNTAADAKTTNNILNLLHDQLK
jgi:outer membrane protein assembly factor BamC